MNHYQISLSDEFSKLFPNKFLFIETEKVPEFRKKTGFASTYNVNYITQFYKDSAANVEIINNSRIVIFGSGPNKILKTRLKRDLLTFYYIERIFKKKNPLNLAYSFLNMIKHHYFYRNNRNLYMLAASSYNYKDFRVLNLYRDKTFKWGYFPSIENNSQIKKINSVNNSEIQFLWVGRFVKWKRPFDVVKLSLKLRELGYSFSVNMIGEGNQKLKVKKSIQKFHLEKYIKLIDGASNNEVLNYMAQSNVFLFTSNSKEGWGVVVNEAMMSKNVIIANQRAGSIKSLIVHKENGLVYSDFDELLHHTIHLFNCHECLENYGLKAYQTILNYWNPVVASKRLISVINDLPFGIEKYMDGGPMSLVNEDE